MNTLDIQHFQDVACCKACGRPLEPPPTCGLSLVGKTLSYKEQTLDIPAREAQVMRVLMDAYPKSVTQQRIFSRIWSTATDPKVVQVYMSFLRKKLKPWGLSITTSYTIGYALVIPE